jgi:hypothetical protein
MILVSISKQSGSRSYYTVIREKRDITSLLGQMCPPAATSASFGELGPIVPSGVWWVVRTCSLPGVAVSRAHLVIVDSTPCLNRGRGVVCGEGTRHWWQSWWLWGEGAFCRFSSLAGEGAEVAAVVTVMFREVGVIDRAASPKVGVPLWQDAVGVMTVDMWGRALMTPMSHLQAVETEPLCGCVHTHHVRVDYSLG